MYDVISKKNKWNSLIFSDVCYCFEIADFELLMNSVVKINQFWQIYFEISKEIENTKFLPNFWMIFNIDLWEIQKSTKCATRKWSDKKI